MYELVRELNKPQRKYTRVACERVTVKPASVCIVRMYLSLTEAHVKHR